MPGTNFIDKNTVITAVYMNGVDAAIYDAIGDGVSPPSSPEEVKTNLSLDNVDNTSDLNKPISTATQTVLDLKVSKDSSTGAATLPSGTTAERPAGGAGKTRFNSTLNIYEGYNTSTSAWEPLGGAAKGGAGNYVFFENDITVTVDYTITTNKNAMSAGPITIASGVTVTVPSGSVWSVI